jgi:hypothetical protein
MATRTGNPFTPEMITQGVGSGGQAFTPYNPSQAFYNAPKQVQDMMRAGQGPAGFQFGGPAYMGPPPEQRGAREPSPPVMDSAAQWAQANRPAGWAPPQGAPGAAPSTMTMTPKERWDQRQATEPQMNHSASYGGSGQGYEPPASNDLNQAIPKAIPNYGNLVSSMANKVNGLASSQGGWGPMANNMAAQAKQKSNGKGLGGASSSSGKGLGNMASGQKKSGKGGVG